MPENTGDNHHSSSAPIGNSDQNNNTDSHRRLVSVTMDPNVLHSSVSNLLHSMQMSIFGGLETLSREMAQLEQEHMRVPWTLPGLDGTASGPKKRYRITIEEIDPEEPPTADQVTSTTISTRNNSGGLQPSDEFTIRQGKEGTSEQGKTFITTEVNPSLMEWVLFASKEDSWFKNLGQKSQVLTSEPDTTTTTNTTSPLVSHSSTGFEKKFDQDGYYEELDRQQQEARIVEQDGIPIKSSSSSRHRYWDEKDQEEARARLVPAIVEKVKQVGATFEQEAREWTSKVPDKWKKGADEWKKEADQWRKGAAEYSRDWWWHDQEKEAKPSSEREGSESRSGSSGWPSRFKDRFNNPHHHYRSESYSQTTLTRPDGSVESKVVSTKDGQTETMVQIKHVDGTVEETVTREAHEGGKRGWRSSPWPRHHHHHQKEKELPQEPQQVSNDSKAVNAQEYATDRDQEHSSSASSSSSSNGRSWPPRGWIRRQERESSERD